MICRCITRLYIFEKLGMRCGQRVNVPYPSPRPPPEDVLVGHDDQNNIIFK